MRFHCNWQQGLRIGFVVISSWAWWRFVWHCRHDTPLVGLFRKRYKGVYNPRRWGFYIWGIEIGSRG